MISSPESAGALPGELCVMLDLGAVVCALPTRWVARLLLLEEAQLQTRGAGPGSALGQSSVLDVGGQHFAAWDLSELLGVEAAAHAWVLMSLPHRGKSVPIALRTGACLVVDVLGPTVPVPTGIFRARGTAFPAGFDVAQRRKTAQAVVGLYFDPRGLFTPAELEASAERVRAAGETS